jgi:heat shock protein HslJ
MELEANGTVAMRLDCNRATGMWTSTPTSDEGGSLEFGPLAMTRALCPQPSLDQQIARQAEYLRSYILRDGRLYISLMADGGIYVWEPYRE